MNSLRVTMTLDGRLLIARGRNIVEVLADELPALAECLVIAQAGESYEVVKRAVYDAAQKQEIPA